MGLPSIAIGVDFLALQRIKQDIIMKQRLKIYLAFTEGLNRPGFGLKKMRIANSERTRGFPKYGGSWIS